MAQASWASPDEGYSLAELIQVCDLPQTVRVTSSAEETVEFATGKTLVLNSCEVFSVSVHPLGCDPGGSAGNAAVRVPIDYRGHFVVLPPRHITDEPIFETAGDLMEICPPFFQANRSCPDVSYECGDTFRFVGIVRGGESRGRHLSCRHVAAGAEVYLPERCRGDFSVLEDLTAYTLRELVDLAPVSRCLVLADDSFHAECPELREYVGRAIVMEIPELFLLVTMSGSSDVQWTIPASMEIRVKPCAGSDIYEKPTTNTKRHTLWEMTSDPKFRFPLLVQIVSYPELPRVFARYIMSRSFVALHHAETAEKVLARTHDKHFVIGVACELRFRSIPRVFTCVSDLSQCRSGAEMRILEDIASDFPEPLSLKSGDVLRIPSFETAICRIKNGSSTVKCKVLKCQKLNDKGNYSKLKIPVDFEVAMIEMLSEDERQSWSAADIFRERPKLPLDVETKNFLQSSPQNLVIRLESFVTEPTIILSPAQYQPNSSQPFSLLSDIGLEIPSRHKMVLDLMDCTNSPPECLSFHPRQRIGLGLEELCWQTYLYMDTNQRVCNSSVLLPKSQQIPRSLSSRSVGDRSSRFLPRLKRSISSFSLSKRSKVKGKYSETKQDGKFSKQLASCSNINMVYKDDDIYENMVLETKSYKRNLGSDALITGVAQNNLYMMSHYTTNTNSPNESSEIYEDVVFKACDKMKGKPSYHLTKLTKK